MFKQIIYTILGLLIPTLTPGYASDSVQLVHNSMYKDIEVETPSQLESLNENVLTLSEAIKTVAIRLNNSIQNQSNLAETRSRSLVSLIERKFNESYSLTLKTLQECTELKNLQQNKENYQESLDSVRQEIRKEINANKEEIMNEISELKLLLVSFIEKQTRNLTLIPQEINENMITRTEPPSTTVYPNVANEDGITTTRTTIEPDQIITKKPIGTLETPSPTVWFNITNEDGVTTPITIEPDQIVTKVRTASELHEALRDLPKGSVIQLAAGIYSGQFTILEDNIVLRGKGKETIIKIDTHGTPTNHEIALSILGDNCQLHNLRLLSNLVNTMGISINGSSTTVNDVHLQGFSHGVKTHSDGNHLHNIVITSTGQGFEINGNNNTLNTIKLNSIHWWGMYLRGDSNSVSNLDCDKCRWVCGVEGDYNKLENIEDANSIPNGWWGIYIYSGEGNRVESYGTDQKGLGLGISPPTNGAVIRNVVSTKVWVQGTGHTLFKVDAGKLMEVEGSDHRIELCKAKKLINKGSNVTWIVSSFEKIESPPTPLTGPEMTKLKTVGTSVVRGRDWRWANQDGTPPGVGKILELMDDGWVTVEWKDGTKYNYRMGNDGKYDLKLADISAAV